MSILKSPHLKSVTATDPDNPMFEPEQVVEQLRLVQARIAGYVHLPNSRQMQTIKRRASVNVEFAREAISVVGASETVQRIVGNSPAELHAAESEVGRWTAVEAELRSMLRAVVAANMLRRERIGLAALQVYNLSRELVRQEDHAGLLPHVEAMSRIPKYNRRTNRAAAKKADPAQPASPAADSPKPDVTQ